MDKFGISKLDLKRRNRTQVLKILRQFGPTSRIDISGDLDITRAAVTIITNEMIEQGVIYEKGEANYAGKKATRGRKKILIDINSNYKFAFGVVVDSGFISIGLTNLIGDTLEKTLIPLDKEISLDELLLNVVKTVDTIKTNNCLTDEKVVGMGVCVSTDHYKDMGIKMTRFVPDFTSLKVAIEKLVAYPVVVSDLINSLAQAEIDFNMQGEKPDNVMFVRYSNNIDASVIIDNKPYKGFNNAAMNIAHAVVQADNGELCECGKKGCLKTLVSPSVLVEKIKKVYSKENTPALFEATGGNVENSKVIFTNPELICMDKPVADICKDSADYFILTINNSIMLFDPDKVVLIGKMFENEVFYNYFKENIQINTPADEHTNVLVSNFDLKTNYLAGCSIAIREFFVEKGGFDRK